MEEVVRAFNFVIEKGWVSHTLIAINPNLWRAQAFYWATSEWSAVELEEAFRKYPSLQWFISFLTPHVP